MRIWRLKVSWRVKLERLMRYITGIILYIGCRVANCGKGGVGIESSYCPSIAVVDAG